MMVYKYSIDSLHHKLSLFFPRPFLSSKNINLVKNINLHKIYQFSLSLSLSSVLAGQERESNGDCSNVNSSKPFHHNFSEFSEAV